MAAKVKQRSKKANGKHREMHWAIVAGNYHGSGKREFIGVGSGLLTAPTRLACLKILNQWKSISQHQGPAKVVRVRVSVV